MFYGELRAGQPVRGVLEQPDGFLAGEVAQGVVQATDEPEVTLRAFREAEKAARAASNQFKAANNHASAQFYARKARRLAEQMD